MFEIFRMPFLRKLNQEPKSVGKNNGTNDKFYRKIEILMFNFSISGLKAEKQLRNQNHTEDWALGCHPRYNSHVTH